MDKYQPAKHVYIIGSGKGGVGKSTVTVNTAIALALEGAQVGLLDADIYGPSIPIMTGLRRLSPKVQRAADGSERVVPFQKFGIKIMSIGFFVEEARSTVWRGPMLHGVLEKMIRDVDWGHLDFLFIDLPPGTGDVPISLAQLLPVEGAIVVTTPQEVAALDAIKAINSFDNLKIPLIGVVENMSGLILPGLPQPVDIFGKGKGEELAHRFHAPFLGRIPLIPSISKGGDEGHPAAFNRSDEDTGCHFRALAQAIRQQTQEKIANPFS